MVSNSTVPPSTKLYTLTLTHFTLYFYYTPSKLFKCTNSQETKDLVNSIDDTVSKLLLLTNSPSWDSLIENIYSLASLQQECSRDWHAVKLEK